MHLSTAVLQCNVSCFGMFMEPARERDRPSARTSALGFDPPRQLSHVDGPWEFCTSPWLRMRTRQRAGRSIKRVQRPVVGIIYHYELIALLRKPFPLFHARMPGMEAKVLATAALAVLLLAQVPIADAQGPSNYECRMAGEAANTGCGLPYALSNFQGTRSRRAGAPIAATEQAAVAKRGCGCPSGAVPCSHQTCPQPPLPLAAGNFACDSSVKIGRPRNVAELQEIVAKYPRVKVGVLCHAGDCSSAKPGAETHPQCWNAPTSFTASPTHINHSCNVSQQMKPRNSVRQANGVGGSWWGENFCSGNDSDSVNVVMTEIQTTLDK